MIIKPLTEPIHAVPQINKRMLQALKLFRNDNNLSDDDFYAFCTTPSAERDRFFGGLSDTVEKIDGFSVIISKTV